MSDGEAIPELTADSSVQNLMQALSAKGLDHLVEFKALLDSCYLKTVGATRLFAPALPSLVDNLFGVADEDGGLQKLKSKGYLAVVMVSEHGFCMCAARLLHDVRPFE